MQYIIKVDNIESLIQIVIVIANMYKNGLPTPPLFQRISEVVEKCYINVQMKNTYINVLINGILLRSVSGNLFE